MASPTGSPTTPLRILFIGNNDSGKSTLINKFSGHNNLAVVGDPYNPTLHEKPLMELECMCSTPNGDVPITFCDTQGFSDMTTGNRNIAETVADNMKKANVILICHRLYNNRVDGTVKEILGELARIFGNDLMKHTILVFTKGDQYPKNGNNDELKPAMLAHAEKLTEAWKKALLSTGIKEDIVKDIPWCITSGEEDKLPTSDDWTKELWDLCEVRCTRDAQAFVGWIKRHAITIAKTTVVAGATTFGGVIGTIAKPGGGTAAGIATSASIGIVLGEGVSKMLT